MKDLNHYKKVYNETSSPAATHHTILEGIEIAGRKRRKKPVFLIAQGLAAAFILLIFTINAFPSAAAALSDIPVLGTLVQVFTINQPEITGGEITDGDNVREIITNQTDQEAEEELVITFSENSAPLYTAAYSRSPFTLTIEVNGVRDFDAAASFEEIARQNEHIERIYPLITLDDSAVRFNIVFTEHIDYVISEYSDPGRLIITFNIAEDQPTGTVYSVRTASMENNEMFGHMEEFFYDIDTLRILKDEQENPILELGMFTTEQEAQDRLQEITSVYGNEYPLLIEERDTLSVPVFVAE